MRILVTGASGFLGRRLVSRLAADGNEVAALVRSPADLQGVATIEGDAGVPGWNARLPERIDAVVHLAQSRRYRDFPDGALDMFYVNVAMTAALVDHAARHGARQFILASTGSVYRPSAAPVTEEGAIAPPDYYAASKYAAELLASAYRARLGICIFRIFRLYGPGQTTGLVPGLIERLREGRPITLAGQDGMRLTPTYVDDAANIVARAITNNWTGTFNLAQPKIVSLRELATKLSELMGKRPNFELADEALDIVPDTARLAGCYPVDSMKTLDQGLAKLGP